LHLECEIPESVVERWQRCEGDRIGELSSAGQYEAKLGMRKRFDATRTHDAVARMMSRVLASSTMRPLLCLLALSTAVNADWPTYLHDASRVGATKERFKRR
jgi:hypothetical protein